MLSSYSKIYNLGHAAVQDIFLDEVYVEEKVDGSQFSFGVHHGQLKMRSRKTNIDSNSGCGGIFQNAVATAKNLYNKGALHDEWTYRGEAFQRPKHNILAYDRIPEGGVIIFDIDCGDQMYYPYETKKKIATDIGLECVPLLFHGKINSIEQLKELLDTPSILGGQKIEGIVVKNYKRFTVDSKTMMGKYVSEQFKEIKGDDWRKRNPSGGDIIQTLIERYKTHARWEKAVQHLAERGKLTNELRDIGELISEVGCDILEECTDDIKQQLFEWAWSKMRRAITSGLPEWYKDKLLKRSTFEESAHE